MTKLLDKAFAAMSNLSEEEQDAVARQLLAWFGDETRSRVTGSLTDDEIEAARKSVVPDEIEQKRVIAEFAKAASQL